MPDLLDHASGLESQFTEVALATQLAKANRKAKESAQDCFECGEQIPLARREASEGCQYCIDCQVLADKGLI
ncbi:TraR/DksA C4-type zinc finger protein [Vibrio lamellibrachiae]|uniref:TraR/DksA C4-type zinc finger protein n=1 Tax=Vibrio lamellibrachiae TaxID=2910253 RepID=UPI003D0B1749